MTKTPLVSIVIDNYNYGRFLSDAIDSALKQTYTHTEVIVVDDGSTDSSSEVIDRYGDEILSIRKSNGGQGSAFNSGFKATRGDIIYFLDADDILLPHAIEHIVPVALQSGVVSVQWYLCLVDAEGDPLGSFIPAGPLSQGDVLPVLIKSGPLSHVFSPGGGNAWRRSYLEAVLPMPETDYFLAADSYLVIQAPLYGELRSIDECLVLYRQHGNNFSKRHAFSDQLKNWENWFALLAMRLQERGIDADLGKWRSNPQYQWTKLLTQIAKELFRFIPQGEKYILVDMNEFGAGKLIKDRTEIPFLEKNGLFWGAPENDFIAIRELERLRVAGAHFIVFGWPAFWWLEHYIDFNEYVRLNYRCLLNNDHFVVFDLREAKRYGIGDESQP